MNHKIIKQINNHLYELFHSPKKPNEVVYFLSSRNKTIKIGYTSNIKKRINTLSTCMDSEPELLCTIIGNRELELLIHVLFDSERIRGEWFHDCKDIRDFIILLKVQKDLEFIKKRL